VSWPREMSPAVVGSGLNRRDNLVEGHGLGLSSGLKILSAR